MKSSKLTFERKIEAVIQARQTTAKTLLTALEKLPKEGFTEKQLANMWIEKIEENQIIRNCGWYLPPPNGMSILIGNPPDYSRLKYNSLREIENWPSSEIQFSNSSILYPYFSAVHRNTVLLGDFVGTFYGGKDTDICNWLKTAYKLTLEIARFIQPNQQISDIYNFAQDAFNSIGAANNTYSQSGGLASDIGHSIPGFCENWELVSEDLPNEQIASLISNSRWFISKDNNRLLGSDFGLTIEPQLIAPNLPMASFHVLVLFANKKKTIITEFDSLFEYFGMSEWMLIE
jgi:hypothetical protein